MLEKTQPGSLIVALLGPPPPLRIRPAPGIPNQRPGPTGEERFVVARRLTIDATAQDQPRLTSFSTKRFTRPRRISALRLDSSANRWRRGRKPRQRPRRSVVGERKTNRERVGSSPKTCWAGQGRLGRLRRLEGRPANDGRRREAMPHG